MIYLQVIYRIRSERLAEAETKIPLFAKALFGRPRRFKTYCILRHAGSPACFVHFMSFESAEDQLNHVQSPPVKQFVESMLALCEEGPAYSELNTVAIAEPADG